jgi:hypothetical protein
MKLSRKAIRDRNSVHFWMEELAKILFKAHKDGPFLVSWVAKWQMKVKSLDEKRTFVS